ncbi:MAG: hypothetical protein QM813_03160 [Verrucomicrobiota bacterium]
MKAKVTAEQIGQLGPGRPTVLGLKISQWLLTSTNRLDGLSPIELICRDGSRGAKRVAFELEQLELGAAEAFAKVLPNFASYYGPRVNVLHMSWARRIRRLVSSGRIKLHPSETLEQLKARLTQGTQFEVERRLCALESPPISGRTKRPGRLSQKSKRKGSK